MGIYVTIFLIIAGEILDRGVPAEEEFAQDPAYNWYEYVDMVQQEDQETEDVTSDDGDAFDNTDGREVLRYNVGTEEDYQDTHEDAVNAVVVNEINADDSWSYTDEEELQAQEEDVTLSSLESVAEGASVPVSPPVVSVARVGGELVLVCTTAAVINTSTR